MASSGLGRAVFSVYKPNFMGPSPRVEDSVEMQQHVVRILKSFERLTGRKLTEDPAKDWLKMHNDESIALLSVGFQEDPILNYGNLGAQKLFEVNYEQLTTMPGRLTAGPMERAERQEFLDRVARDGFVTDYSGIRTSASGRKFRIKDAHVWNVLEDDSEKTCGQAAFFNTNIEYVE
mmetsp:Transcript_1801/g.3310  ORF Transcript_1801/g.3310 Transcript_1801/m.3310 type:complete len:177 (-) Transcript_1801:222-752(-)